MVDISDDSGNSPNFGSVKASAGVLSADGL